MLQRPAFFRIRLTVSLVQTCQLQPLFWLVSGELEQNRQFFDGYHAMYPDRIIGITESHGTGDGSLSQ